ncbi:MAG: RNA polymerase sigma factor [Ruminococcaceae bacterium]|nr:RNA polymerase sigma factor [Oscillospiraceae bacterium]
MNNNQNSPYMLSDSAIVELYWARDEAAIKHTDLKYRNYLLHVAYNILIDAQDSEECLNDTYLSAWDSMPPHRPNVLQAFLSTITRHLAIDRYRRKHTKKSIPPAFVSPLSDLEGFALGDDSFYSEREASALAEVISAWLRTLDERKRYVFMSRYYDARPIEEIAQTLGCARSTVNADIAFIKTSLKQALAKEGYTV